MAWEIETVFDLNDEDLFTEMTSIDLGLFMWGIVIEGGAGYAQYLDNLSSYAIPDDATSFDKVQFDGSVNPIPTFKDTKNRFFKYIQTIHLSEFNSVDVYRSLEALLPGQLTGMFKRGDWLNSDVEPTNLRPTWNEVKAKNAELVAADIVKATITAAYKTMSDNIAAGVYNLFETTNEASANAFSQSWRIKAERAADYVSAGLVARNAIAGFAIGDALDTEIKIQLYYDEKVNELIAFDQYRDAEIMTYLTAKAAAEV